MFEIIAAITTKYEATPAMELEGGFFHRKARQGCAMPYGVYNVEADDPEENTGTGYVQRVRVTIEIYAKKAKDLQTESVAFRDALYHQPLTLSAGRIIAAEMQGESIDDLETDDATEPQVMYQLVIEYLQTQTRA